MFTYDIMTEQEAIEERYSLLKDGIYDAVVTASEDRTSSSGNPMMSMTLQVFDENGKAKEVRDFLVFTKSMMWKVIHFADSAGVSNHYQNGTLCSQVVIDARVRVKIGIQEGALIPEDKLKGKPVGSKYPEKNRVEDYIKKSEQTNLSESTNDADIPF